MKNLKKNIQMKEYNFDNFHWQITSYDIDKYKSYEKCLRAFDSIDATKYDLTSNNCMHFAYEIKNKILE